jgi:hypothetical protein
MNTAYKLFLAGMALTVGVANATDFHVKSAADLDRANKAVKPGDSVYFDKDVTGGRINPASSGKDGKYISYYGNGYTITKPATRVCVKLANKSYIRVSGLNCDGGVSGPKSSVLNWIALDDAHYNVIERGTFQNAKGWYGVLVDGGSSYNRFQDLYMQGVGEYCDRSQTAHECMSGDLFVFKDAAHNLLQNSTLKAGGHNLFGVYGSYNILRGLTLSNAWPANKKQGYRTGEISMNTRKVADAKGHNVLEDSVIANGGEPPNQFGVMVVKSEGVGQLIRNVVFANNGSNVAISSNERPPIIPVSRDGRIYKITVVGQSDLWARLQKGIAGYTFYNVAGDARVNHSVTGANTLAASKFLANLKLDKEYCPQAGSPLIDAGTLPTRTRTAGQGTVVPVQDVSFFTDGEGIVEDYKIQVGKQVAEIQQVNYQNETIEVTTNLKWNAGEGVGQPYAGLAPDIGACEYRQ